MIDFYWQVISFVWQSYSRLLRVCLGLYLKNRVFKSKSIFQQNFIFKLLPTMCFDLGFLDP